MRSSSPLRPGQEFTTGGRTALTQWEFYDALSQMYQAQVFLNVVRLVEYGEAPLHFKFSDVTATITDSGGVASGFEFFDSPLGVNIVGQNVIGTGQTNVKFTPSLSLDRKVQIQAKATPVTDKDWIYDWYYTVADYFLENGSSKSKRSNARCFYERFTGVNALCEALKASKDHRLALWYRGDLYAVRQEYDEFVKKEISTVSPKPITPEEELGALTTLISLLRESSPRNIRETEIRFPFTFLKPNETLDQARKRITAKLANGQLEIWGETEQMTTRTQALWEGIENFLKYNPGDARSYEFTLSFPIGEGTFADPKLALLKEPKEPKEPKKPKEPKAPEGTEEPKAPEGSEEAKAPEGSEEPKEAEGSEEIEKRTTWVFKTPKPTDFKCEGKPTGAKQACERNRTEARLLRKNVDEYLKYQKKAEAISDANIVVKIRGRVDVLVLRDLVRGAAGRPGIPAKKKTEDLLAEILRSLDQLRVQLDNRR